MQTRSCIWNVSHTPGYHSPTFLLHPVWFAKTVLMLNDSLTLAKLDSKSTFSRVTSGTTILLEGVGSSYSDSSYSDSVVVNSGDWWCFALSVVSLVLHGARLKQFPWSLWFLVVRKTTCDQYATAALSPISSACNLLPVTVRVSHDGVGLGLVS